MALLSDLVSICAQHRLDSEATLGLFSRELREAGRVSKAGRGRGAAKMTFLDGARFLIACAATDHPKRAADAEQVFSNLTFSDGERHVMVRGDDEPAFVADDSGASPTLDIALASLLEDISSGALRERAAARLKADGLEGAPVVTNVVLDVFRSGASAKLQADGRYWTYRHPLANRMIDAEGHDAKMAAMAEWQAATDRFVSGKNLIASFDSSLIHAIAHAIGGTAR